MKGQFKEQAIYDDGHSWEETDDRQRVINGWMVWEYCTKCGVQRQLRTFDVGDSRAVWQRDPDPTPKCIPVITDLQGSGLKDLIDCHTQYQFVVEAMAELAAIQGGRLVSATPEEIARCAGIDAELVAMAIPFLIKAGILEKIGTNQHRFPSRQRFVEIVKERNRDKDALFLPPLAFRSGGFRFRD